SMMVPCSSTTPAAILVPPTSTPIVRLICGLSRFVGAPRRAGGASRGVVSGRGTSGRGTSGRGTRRRGTCRGCAAVTWPGRQYRVDGSDHVTHRPGDDVGGIGEHGPARPGLGPGLRQAARGPADRAPCALRGLARRARRLRRRGTPHVPGVTLLTAKRLPHL